jgi:S1-C subfamily serine protease
MSNYYYRKKATNMKWIVVALVLILLVSLISQYALFRYYQGEFNKVKETQRSTLVRDFNIASAADFVMPSVVGISSVTIIGSGESERSVESVGTGVVVTEDGYILTNAHVIELGKSDSVIVIMSEGTHLKSEVVWFDERLDLALIKVEAVSLIPIKMGNSDDLVVGESAIAIGNPLGLEFQKTVTAGIVSGLHRKIEMNGTYVIENLIQTDASINPGNSGGPLINAKGEVIGINTIKMDSAEGLGFAIPINSVKVIIEEVTKEGSFEVVELGLSALPSEAFQDLTGQKTAIDKGLVVIRVMPGSVSEVAGIVKNDIITHIDGVVVDNFHNLLTALYSYKKGEAAYIKVNRFGEVLEFEVTFK